MNEKHHHNNIDAKKNDNKISKTKKATQKSQWIVDLSWKCMKFLDL